LKSAIRPLSGRHPREGADPCSCGFGRFACQQPGWMDPGSSPGMTARVGLTTAP